MKTVRWSLAVGLTAWFFSAASARAEPLSVVATFSILADLVLEIGGEHVAVTALVGPGADTHVFQPAPGDAKRVLAAGLVVVNGLGFEGWVDRLVEASGYRGPIVQSSRGVEPLAAEEHAHDHASGKSDRQHATAPKHDPHAWQNTANVRIYVNNIRDGLAAADPAHADYFQARAATYVRTLEALDAEIRGAFAPIPAAKRRVITSHDAFAYYGRAYGITFSAPQGVSSDAEPSAKAVAALIRQIKREGVKAIFVETVSNPRVIQRIAKETGAKVSGPLYSDSLSRQGGPAASYLAMMRHNTALFLAAMK